MKRYLLSSVVLAIVFATIIVVVKWGIVSMLLLPARVGAIAESWETANQTMRVRVDRHHEENGGFVPGAYYVFRSAQAGSDGWRDIMTFRHDDPVPIPRDQVRFVMTTSVLSSWVGSMRTDSGATWSVWDGSKNLPNWLCCNYGLIETVRLEPDGTGTMQLSPISGRSGEVPQLHTKDYGRHWNT